MLSILFLWIVLLEPKVFSSFISYVCVILSTKLCETGSLVASKKNCARIFSFLVFPRRRTSSSSSFPISSQLTMRMINDNTHETFARTLSLSLSLFVSPLLNVKSVSKHNPSWRAPAALYPRFVAWYTFHLSLPLAEKDLKS